MKKIFLLTILGFFVLVPIANSSVWVYTDKNTKEVIFLSESNDVVIDSSETNIKEDIIPNNIEFYNLTELYTDYKFNGTFTLNTKKMSDKQDEKDQRDADKVKKDADLETAKSKLIGLGLTTDEVQALHP